MSDNAAIQPEPVWTGRATSGLTAMLRRAAPPGAGVLVPANLCAIAVAGIVWAGLTPVFHDVSDRHGNTELVNLEAAWTETCRIVLAVHNFGRPLPIDEIVRWSVERELIVIEDVCNAIGGTFHGRALGSFGEAALYSFNHGKIVDLGSGGAIAIRDRMLRQAVADDIAAMPPMSGAIVKATKRLENGLRAARVAGDQTTQADIYENFRSYALIGPLSDAADTVGRGLEGLAENIAHRRAISDLYRRTLAVEQVEHVPPVVGEVPWRHNVLVPAARREALIVFLRQRNVPVSAWYPPVSSLFGDADETFPGARRFGDRVINLWADQTTRPEDAARTSALITSFFGGQDA